MFFPSLPYQIGNGRRVPKNFTEKDRFFFALPKSLGRNGLQYIGKNAPDFFLLFSREGVYHPSQCFSDVSVMERGNHEMPCFRRHKCGLHGLFVPHFPDGNHVGIFSQRLPDSLGKIRYVLSHLTLVNERTGRRNQILRRIFKRHDMTGSFFSYSGQYSRQSRTFSAP